MDEHLREKTLLRITDIEFANSQLDDKIVGVFRFEPVGGKTGPTLLVIAEVDSVGYAYDQLIDVVNNEAEHSRNLLSGVDHDPVTRFEKIVKNINETVAEFIKGEETPLNWSRINMFILELSDRHLCLAGTGRLMNMFLQKQKDDSYRTFDLFGSLDQPVEVNEEKVFSNIICGDFRAGDLLIAGSKNLENIRNELRIKERLTTMPPVSAALEIKQDLEDRGIPDDFVATVVASIPEGAAKAAAVAPKGKAGSTASIEKLRSTERETNQALGATIAPQNADTAKGEPSAPRLQGRFGFLNKVFTLLKRDKLRDVATHVSLRGMHGGFGSLFSKRKKTFIVGGVALVIVAVIAVFAIKHQQTLAAERAAWNSSYDQIKATIEQAEGEQVYSEDRARRTLAEAMTMLADLDASSDERAEAMTHLNDTAGDLRQKLRREIVVSNPKVLYALMDGIAEGSLGSPVILNGSLLVADRSSQQLTTIDLETGDKTNVELPDDSGEVAGLGEGSNDTVIVVTKNRSAYAANPESGNVQSITLGGADSDVVNDAIVYANRVYILDASAEQIWRHPTTGSGFGSGQKYLQASASDLTNATALSIDSNVYVLKADGVIVRYFGGGQDGFSLTPIDPPLTNGNGIWAHADNPYIAVADAESKRVVLYTKEGNLVAQYRSEAWSGPTDVVADLETKKLYVIDSNKIYELLLP